MTANKAPRFKKQPMTAHKAPRFKKTANDS